MDDDDYSKTCGPVMDRRNVVNLDELFVPLSAKSKECDDLVAVAEESENDDDDDEDRDRAAPVTAEPAAASLVNDINTRFSNDCTQTVGPYLDMADPSRKVSVRDLFKPLDCKSKEVQNLAEEPCSDDDDGADGSTAAKGDGDDPTQQTQTCGPVMIDDATPAKQSLERVFDRKPDDQEVPNNIIVRHFKTDRM